MCEARSREKHTTTSRVFPYTSFVLYRLLRALQQHRAQSRLRYFLNDLSRLRSLCVEKNKVFPEYDLKEGVHLEFIGEIQIITLIKGKRRVISRLIDLCLMICSAQSESRHWLFYDLWSDFIKRQMSTPGKSVTSSRELNANFFSFPNDNCF